MASKKRHNISSVPTQHNPLRVAEFAPSIPI
uniref:Uncharacterized protein n=1 Tax=Arundo donax TaxID=35708 RepID=A0A0A8YJ16_ARUDO